MDDSPPYLNNFMSLVSFYTHATPPPKKKKKKKKKKTSGNPWFSDVLRGYRKKLVA